MLTDANGEELQVGATYQKGTRKRQYLGRDLWYIIYRNSRGVMYDINAEKWFSKSVKVAEKHEYPAHVVKTL